MSRIRRHSHAARRGRAGRLLFSIIWLILYLVAVKIWWTRTLYLQLLFFAGLIFCYREDFSARKLVKCFTYGARFWLPVTVTVLLVWLAYRYTAKISTENYLGVADGIIGGWTHSNWEIVLSSLSMIFLMPVAEELFFRKAIIRTDKGAFFFLISFVLSTALFALSHALKWLGIAEYVIIGIPLGLAYVLTGNIYVPIVAHMIIKIIESIPSAAYAFARTLLR